MTGFGYEAGGLQCYTFLQILGSAPNGEAIARIAFIRGHASKLKAVRPFPDS